MLKRLSSSKDVIYKETKSNCVICYQEQLCNILEFMKDFYPIINSNIKEDLDKLFPGICKKIDADMAMMEQMLFSGLLLAYRNFNYYAFDLAKPPSRLTSDSITEAEGAFSARDGFVENFKDNIALIRTRIRDAKLNIDSFMIGRRSKTNVSLLSISDIHNDEIKGKIIDILNKIDIDAIISMNDICAYFQEGKLFPSYQYIGSPDLACRRLLNGEFIIVIDRISIVLAVPITLSITTRLSIDNFNNPIFNFVERGFILFAFFISTIFLGLLCSFTTYQADSLSLRALSILKVTQKGVIFPIFFEILIVLALFEFFYFICFRQPKTTISSTVVLIGGLIIGENLVSTGIAGMFIITFTAISFLMSFVVSGNVSVLMSLSISRLIILLSSFYFGVLGVLLSSIVILYYLYTQRSLGIPYFYPFIPFDLRGLKYFFISRASLSYKQRDKIMGVKNKNRRSL